MKKILFILVCAACAFNASAQRASSSSTTFFSTEKAEQSVTFGIRVGMNSSNMQFSGEDDSDSPDNKIGFNAGVSVDIPMLQSLYLQTGLYYTTKGYKVEENDGDEKYTTKATPSYLEIPVMASYRYDFSDNAQLQVNFGPYFAYGIGGKYKEEWSYKGEKEEEKEDLFGKDKYLTRFDAGLGIGAGFTYSKFFFGLNYQFGLSNILQDAKDGYSVKNKNLSISIGYNF